MQKLRQFQFLTLAIKISFLFDFCTDVLLTRNFSLWYPYIILHGDGEHHQWLWDQVWFKSMASFAWGILNQNQKAFYLKAIKTNNEVVRPNNKNPKRQWTLKLNTCKLSAMLENAHHLVLISFNISYCIWLIERVSIVLFTIHWVKY